jgi:hypothetical protein
MPMRAATMCLVSFLLANLSPGATIAPANSDRTPVVRLDAVQVHSPERWQGRQHYLYDEDHQPGGETVGSAGSNAKSCEDERVQMRGSDGTTIIRRLNRC